MSSSKELLPFYSCVAGNFRWSQSFLNSIIFSLSMMLQECNAWEAVNDDTIVQKNPDWFSVWVLLAWILPIVFVPFKEANYRVFTVEVNPIVVATLMILRRTPVLLPATNAAYTHYNFLSQNDPPFHCQLNPCSNCHFISTFGEYLRRHECYQHQVWLKTEFNQLAFLS